MRLNNYISSSGLCSRREADELIKSNRVTVNGKKSEIGYSVTDNDIVKVDGKILHQKKEKIYIALYKPIGITCTTEEHIIGNIINYVNFGERIFPIGRLDKDSEGLILLTNDGDIVNKILREENHHEKEYIVKVDKKLDNEFLVHMSNGVKIYNPVKNNYTTTNPCRIELINEYSFRIILSQGLNRQIRRMCQFFGYNINKLKRTRILNITIKNLQYGKWRFLTEDEVNQIKNI